MVDKKTKCIQITSSAKMKRLTIFMLSLVLGLSLGDNAWWHSGNFYQIYPRSFMDSNGDGIGDLNGAATKLQYIKDIGMDAIWFSPIFKSPMADFGYDISDYTQIQDEYGNVDDLLRLTALAHRIGLRVVLDFVPNHTSDEHEWFVKSVNGDAYYRDFYVWHDGVINATTGQRQAPNNWLSSFRYSAWEWNEQRQQYYLHQFSVKQPDLNYRNPNVVEALKDTMRYWLALGIDGFRIDAVPFLYEVEVDPQTGTYPDEPDIEDVSSCPDPNDWCHHQHIYTNSLPESFEMVFQWRQVVDDWQRDYQTDAKVLLTEAYTSFENLMLMYGNGERKGAHVPFNFEMLSGLTNQSTASDYKYYVDHWLDNMPEGVEANWVLGNHDNRRLASRYGVQRTDLINVFLQTLPGIAVTYNGEEYGIEDVYVSWTDSVDIQACNTDPETFDNFSRDPVRTPFRWNSSINAGFSTAAKTWLPVGAGYEENNVAAQLAADNSHLKIFKLLTELRKTEAAFIDGSYESLVVQNVLLYKRQSDEGDAFIVVLNVGGDDVVLDLTQHFEGVPEQVQAAVSSLQSGLINGGIFSANAFEAKAYNAYVLRLLAD